MTNSSAGEKDKSIPRNTRKKNERPWTTEHTEYTEGEDIQASAALSGRGLGWSEPSRVESLAYEEDVTTPALPLARHSSPVQSFCEPALAGFVVSA